MSFSDIDDTGQPDREAALQQILLEYQAILDNASLGIVFTRDRIFLRCNARFGDMFGWPVAELIGQSIAVVYPTDDAFNETRARIRSVLSRGQRLDIELQMKRRDGSLFWCRLLANAIDPAEPAKGTIYITADISKRKAAEEALLRARDELEQRVQERTAELALANARLQAEIQERKLAEQQIRYLADHDALTGLPNRRLLEDRIAQAMEHARRHGGQVAIQYIDLDCFKPVNDKLGHRIGDLLLQATAVRLRALLRAVDTVSRVGGDEFVLVLPDVHSTNAVIETAQKVLQALTQAYVIEGHELCVTPSIGISLFPRDADSVETLLACADAAMYRAKSAGRANWQLFTPDMKQ